MGQRSAVGRGLAMGQRCCGAALTGLCRGAAAILGCPSFPRAHALLLGALVAAGPLLRGRGDPHSVLASPHNRLEARLTGSALAWTWLLIGSLLVASQPWLRPPWGHALRALLRLAVAVGVSRAGHALGHALEAATGQCRAATPLGTLLLPLGDPAQCRGAGHSWEGFGPAPQAFALVHCGLGLAEEAAALGRSLYGRGKMADGGKMAGGGGWGEGSKMAARSKMAAWWGSREGSKMAAEGGWSEGSKMADRSKMAAWWGWGEGSKMAARSKMAAEESWSEGSKMAAGGGWSEGSKMASRSKMAAEGGWGEGSKMAAWYGLEGESKMAARSKMAAGLGWTEGSKMAAGSARSEESKMAARRGWAWPRSIWWPIWAGGGHLEQPYMDSSGGHFERHGGHFEPGSGGHFDRRSGGHFEHHGGHFEERSGGHFERRSVSHFDHHSRHFDPHSGHFDPHSRHFDPHSGHFDPHSRHFEPHSGHFKAHSGHFEPPGDHFDYHSRHFEHRGGHYDPHSGHFEAHSRHFDPHSSHFKAHSGHFEHPGGHFEAYSGHFPPVPGDSSTLPPRGGGGHLVSGQEAPPLALSALYLLALALLLTWHLLLGVTLTYRHTWARNAAGAALGWAGWAVTYRGWYRWAWSPGPPGWG